MKKYQTAPFMFMLSFYLGLFMISCEKKDEGAKASLLCYVGGTMRPAMEELATLWEQKSGQRVHIDFAGSGELLVKMQQTEKGDLYVAHDPFLAAVMNKKMGVKGWTVAVVHPVIVVPKGNPKNIQGIKDLTKPGIKLVLSHQTYSTMGHLVPKMAEKAGVKEKLLANVVSRTRGGSAAANTVMVGTSDASIVWQAVAHLRRDKLDAIPIEEEYALKKGVDAVSSATFGTIEQGYIRVTIASLKYSKQIDAANTFAEFVASKEGAVIWQKHGFLLPDKPEVVESAENVELKGSIFIHCAAGMRKPVSKLALEFEKKRGVKTELSYDGTNRLLGQIKLTRKGDVYIAGDADYIEMAQKAGLVKFSKDICYFVPVIMVKEDNPLRIKALSNLLGKGIKIGQGDEKACAIGRLMKKILTLNDIDSKSWNRNVVLSTPTVNELGVAVKLGTINAAVVWSSIAENYKDVSEVIEIPVDKNIIPTVGGAVLAFSKNPEGATAFLDFLISARGKEVLSQNGYVVEKPGA